MSVDQTTLMSRLHAYLLATWARSREVIPAHPFVVYLHPTDGDPVASVAMPERPLGGDDAQIAGEIAGGLAAVRGIFASRDRMARVVYFDALAPDLPSRSRKPASSSPAGRRCSSARAKSPIPPFRRLRSPA
jgi:hypothetical protein